MAWCSPSPQRHLEPKCSNDEGRDNTCVRFMQSRRKACTEAGKTGRKNRPHGTGARIVDIHPSFCGESCQCRRFLAPTAGNTGEATPPTTHFVTGLAAGFRLRPLYHDHYFLPNDNELTVVLRCWMTLRVSSSSRRRPLVPCCDARLIMPSQRQHEQ